jgi:hypothetical protein
MGNRFMANRRTSQPSVAFTIDANTLLAQEARALLTRLSRVRPFVLVEPMLTAAAPLPHTQSAIDGYLMRGRKDLYRLVQQYLVWLQSSDGRQASAAEMQKRFTLLRLRFNAVLTQFDMFSDAITQRSEHESGVWLAGLDVVSADALELRGYLEQPPLLCYLDRGVGAAIRRARTRLPGGGENPVALIRVPRERMVGSGIASSLVHEVGHQGAALLDLVASLKAAMKGRDGVWKHWERWISEIVADFWSVARVGITSTLGLMAVVSLPRPFVFRTNDDDPHPMPWIRVMISASIGEALFPHPQWRQIAALWQSYYPAEGLDANTKQLVKQLLAGLSEFIPFLVTHRPQSLRGKTLAEAMEPDSRQPAVLDRLLEDWQQNPAAMYEAQPCIVLAAIGQARLNSRLSEADESTIIGKLLTHWALKTTLDVSTYCAHHQIQPRGLMKPAKQMKNNQEVARV